MSDFIDTFNKYIFPFIQNMDLRWNDNKKRQKDYKDELSIARKRDEIFFFNGEGLFYADESFFKQIKGKKHLLPELYNILNYVYYEKERYYLIYTMYRIGENKSVITRMCIDRFYAYLDNPEIMNETQLWSYGDLIYTCHNYQYIDEVIKLLIEKRYGASRQMLALYLGRSKKKEVIPVLISVLNDAEVNGHAVEALCKFEGMEQYVTPFINDKRKWVSKIAVKYLSKSAKAVLTN